MYAFSAPFWQTTPFAGPFPFPLCCFMPGPLRERAHVTLRSAGGGVCSGAAAVQGAALQACRARQPADQGGTAHGRFGCSGVQPAGWLDAHSAVHVVASQSCRVLKGAERSRQSSLRPAAPLLTPPWPQQQPCRHPRPRRRPPAGSPTARRPAAVQVGQGGARLAWPCAIGCVLERPSLQAATPRRCSSKNATKGLTNRGSRYAE